MRMVIEQITDEQLYKCILSAEVDFEFSFYSGGEFILMSWTNVDKCLRAVPWLYVYLIYIVEEDTVTRFLISIVCSFLFTIYVIVNNKSNVNSSVWRKYKFAPFCVVIFSLAILNLYSSFYFLIGLITITFFSYKIFEFLGDKFESFLHEKCGMPLNLTMLLKLVVWFVGFFMFIMFFFLFVFWYVSLYPNDALSLMILDLQLDLESSLMIYISITAFSIIIAIFIIDYLIKMIFYDSKITDVKDMGRLGIQKLFFKIFITIVFADLCYSLVYITFSSMKPAQFDTTSDMWLLYRNYVKAFYYAFCLHFAIPMPTDSFYINMDTFVRKTPSMHIIQFFHFCINKIIDITMLSYMAGIVLSSLNIKKNK
ncbi:hypothetical protein SAMN05720606_101109 [Paenibacillus polysaccharolyticus]|uniref:Uncharacterized protein n=1 Tax=Paenibacillus polysaccharolyticus TaxID=582692 RepID=A0A1G5AUG8_9BACL|nr:hypothetical protein [Paenibacillus polysaccharolyticus]SCX81501.1 hypothetical protein SAMN05720606_101109 [Paenibacillus polysaccharolyticus]